MPPLESEETEEKRVTQGLKQQTWFLSHLGLCTPERFVSRLLIFDTVEILRREKTNLVCRCEASPILLILLRFRELSERRTERRRRKTANPHFSSAAVEERRRQENERKRKKTNHSDGKNKVIMLSKVRLYFPNIYVEQTPDV